MSIGWKLAGANNVVFTPSGTMTTFDAATPEAIKICIVAEVLHACFLLQ
jgi:hypothetical protein